MSYFPEGVWRVAISFDETLGWSDQTGRALSAKVENKKIPTSQKNLLTSPTSCGTIRMYQGRGNEKTLKKSLKNLKKSLDKLPPLWYNKSTKRVATYRQRKELIP